MTPSPQSSTVASTPSSPNAEKPQEEESPANPTVFSDDPNLEREFSSDTACKTVLGPKPNQECVFPFTYQGRTYAGCTQSFGVEAPWCSAQTTEVC